VGASEGACIGAPRGWADWAPLQMTASCVLCSIPFERVDCLAVDSGSVIIPASIRGSPMVSVSIFYFWPRLSFERSPDDFPYCVAYGEDDDWPEIVRHLQEPLSD